MKKARRGSHFDDFLEKEGLRAETEAVAIKRVLAYRIELEMKRISSFNLFKIFLALSATLTLSACFFTARWDDKIDQQVVWRHNYWDYYSRYAPLAPEPIAKDAYGAYYKGEYTGIKELNNQKYNCYIFPNLFKNYSNKRLMEILLPAVSNVSSVAIIRTFDQYVKHKEYTYRVVSSSKEAYYKGYMYLRYIPATTNDVPVINPKFIARVEAEWQKYYHRPNYFSDEAFSTDQPPLLDLAVISSSTKTIIRYGNKSKGDATVSELTGNTRIAYVCPTTTNESDALAGAQQYTNGCDRWMWSFPLQIQFADLHTQGDDLEAERRHGYFLTVPLDILTFPVQAVVVVIGYPVAMLFQH